MIAYKHSLLCLRPHLVMIDAARGVVSGTMVRTLVLGRFGQKIEKKTNKNKNIKEVMVWATDVCSRAAFAQPGPVSSISLGWFFSVRLSETDPRPGTWLHLGHLTCSAHTLIRPCMQHMFSVGV